MCLHGRRSLTLTDHPNGLSGHRRRYNSLHVHAVLMILSRSGLYWRRGRFLTSHTAFLTGLLLQLLHRTFKFDDLVKFEHAVIQLLDFLLFQDSYLYYLILWQQELHERTHLLNHAERQKLIDVTISRLDFIVEILAAVV